MPRNIKKQPHIPFALKLIRFAFRYLGPLFPNFFANRAYELWFSAHRHKTPEKERPAEERAEKDKLYLEGFPVATYRWGDHSADKILFVHGWAGRATQCAFLIDPIIDSGYQLISFDGPAHGETPGKQTSVMQFADVIMAIDEEHGPFEAVITHSFGGLVTAYALKNGLRTNRIVNICPIDGFETLLHGYKLTLAVPEVVADKIKTKIYATHGFSVGKQISTVENVRHLKQPALVLHDSDDDDIPIDSGKRIAQAYTNGSFVETSGLGHRRIMRDPEVIQKIVEFISK